MIKNRYKITIKALNQERIFNSLSKKVDVFNLKKENGLTHFDIDRKNKKITKKLLKQHNIKIVSFKGVGLIEKLINLFKSFGVMVALACFFIAYPLQYALVLKIVVLSDKTVLSGQVESYLEEKLDSRFKREIDTKELEKLLLNDFEEVSSVSIAIVGQSLIVSVNQSENPAEMQDDFLPIVSEYDARVESVTLVQGTLAVSVGDIVRKGQTLVYPFIIDSQGEKRACQPKADIIASVWLEGSQVCYDRQIITKRTGRKEEVREIFINDVLVYKSKNINNFLSYEEEVCWQTLTNNNLLPLKIKRTWLYETTTEEVFNDFSKIKEQLIQNAREKALIFLEKNEIIKEENYTIKEEGGWHEIIFVLTVERNIGGMNDTKF